MPALDETVIATYMHADNATNFTSNVATFGAAVHPTHSPALGISDESAFDEPHWAAHYLAEFAAIRAAFRRSHGSTIFTPICAAVI